jgi:hypothetical protein
MSDTSEGIARVVWVDLSTIETSTNFVGDHV